MKKSEWKDRDIEELVKKLPHIKDERDPRTIYAQLERQSKKRPALTKRFVPAIAALAALFILVLLAPALIGQMDEKSMENAEMSTSDSAGSSGENKKVEEEQLSEKEEAPKQNMSLMESYDAEESTEISPEVSGRERLSLYEEDLKGNHFYTFGLVSKDAVPVPISVIDHESGGDWLTRHEQIAGKLPETDWGLEDFLPLKGEFSLKDKTVMYRLAADHPYSGSSAMEYAFYYSLLYSFQHKGMNEIMLQTEDGSVPQFSTMGELKDIDLKDETHSAYYMYSPNDKDRFLVTDNIERESVKDSIQAMKDPDSDLFQSVIPHHVEISVEESDDVIAIRFQDELDLDALGETAGLEMIEGMLLTLRGFGIEKVRFENIRQESWNGFLFNEPVETPISPNKKMIVN
ncbi:hypothetical protein [Bacillus sp. KH172YL63]|uniref:hypothetical protein n=1 Tax=Bacillus sp. KH172YL63 TaxID=2709784 RepID=UPI0013E50F00|nr:hypothetical protein [Bacillus sp. KH172YL63]BCB04578.1 anti-sigma-X factor RsiX [Bacillus sp. KH172YL63]